MKDSWPAPMATSEMPRGEPRLDSPFLEAAERYLSNCQPGRHCSLAASVKRPGPVKSVSVIVPRRRRLISCPETKIATERRGRREEREASKGQRKRENSARGIKTSLPAARGLLSWRTIHVYWSRGRVQVHVGVPERRCVGQSCIRVRPYRRRVSPGVTCGALKMADALMNWH